VVLGISPDKPSGQLKFAEKYSLGFPLLADTEHSVAEAYDVWAEKSMYGRKYWGIVRSAFLIDEKYGLGFPLLADEDHAVAEAYGAWGEKKMYGKSYQGIIRSAFLVDEQGAIQEAWPKVSPKDTPANLLTSLG